MRSAADNYQRIQEEIAAAVQRCGRAPSEINLIAVSKGYSWDHIFPVYGSGCRHFGENRIQEALLKISEAPSDINWHMIGPLQKNKVNKAIGKFTLIHSVDSIELAQKISMCSVGAGKTTSILLQVNTSGEKTKHGLNEEGWRDQFESLLHLPGISLEGLMTMASLIENEAIIRNCFARLRLFKDELISKFGLKTSFRHLSMGMSHDYRYAIAEGATLLRIGTAIFKH